jgi:surface polysaccharide O-acyltransferase-like enzyme
MENMERNTTFDFVKFFAIIFVICIHANPFIGVDYPLVNGEIINYIIETVARFAVPFFFIVSGHLFTLKVTSKKENFYYFQKYILKLGKIFITWSIIYFLYDAGQNSLKAFLSGESIKSQVETAWAHTFSLETLFFRGSDTAYQLWYLTALIWSIVIVYVFIRWKKINLLLIVALMLNIIGLFGQSYSTFYELGVRTRETIFFGLCYTSLGSFFALYKVRIIKLLNHLQFRHLLLAVFLFTILQIIESLFLRENFGAQPGDYYLSTIPLTVSLFSLTLKYPHFGKGSFFTLIGTKTLGIYIIHTMVLSIIDNLIGLFNIEFIRQTVTYYIILIPSVLLISYLTYEYIQRWKNELKSLVRIKV